LIAAFGRFIIGGLDAGSRQSTGGDGAVLVVGPDYVKGVIAWAAAKLRAGGDFLFANRVLALETDQY
jgi:hypothetical protein